MAKQKTKTITRYVKRAKRRAKDTRIPLTVVGGLAPMALDVYGGYKAAGIGGAVDHLSLCTSGVTRDASGNVSVHPMYAVTRLYLPLLAAGIAHKLANRFGVNRRLKAAGVPFISI